MNSPHSCGLLRPAAIAAAVAFLLGGALPLLAQDSGKVDPATWAPKDALFFVGVSDLDTVIEKIRKSPSSKWFSDPAAKTMMEMNYFWKALDSLKERVAKMVGTDADKLQNPFGGPMAVIVTTAPKDGKTVPAFTFVATIKDNTTMRSYYDNTVKRLKETADSHEAVTMGSFSIDHFKTRARADDDKKAADSEAADVEAMLQAQMGEDEMTAMLDRAFGEIFSADAMPESLATCMAEDRLLVSLSPDNIKAVLRSDRGESLKEHDDYKAIDRKFKDAGPVRFFLNVQRLVDIAAAEQGEEFARTRTALGLKCVRNVIGHLEWNGEKYESRMEAILLTSDDCTGVMKILRMKNAPLTPPKFVTADSSMLFSVQLDPTTVVDETERILRQVDPDEADQMAASMTVDLPDGKKLDVRKEIIANLQPPLTYGFGFSKPYGPASAKLMVSIGTRGREVFERLISLAQETGAPLTERETAGSKVYDIMFGFSIGATRDAIVIGSQSQVDAALSASGSDKWLGDDATFKKLADLHPREAWGMVYIDPRKLLEAAIELAKFRDEIDEKAFENPSGMIGAAMIQSFAAAFEGGKLEEARSLLKYQGAQLMSISTTADGILLTAIASLPTGD